MTLAAPPKYLRGSLTVGLRAEDSTFSDRIDREGGKFGQGIIRGVSVITRGEALGHEMWIDQDFVEQVALAINNSPAESGGVKARFTHPSMSADGMAHHLGRLTDARLADSGDRVVADLHFNKASRNTPDGDLATYVIDLAEETPEAFGLSIAFEHDLTAAQEVVDENTVTMQGRDIFTSPDEQNTENYIHARLAKLYAGDVVDEPAANPAGLFSLTSVPADGEAILNFVLGRSSQKPDVSFGDVDAERLKAYVARFLSRHQIEITEVEQMSDDSFTREEWNSQVQRYSAAFGEVNGPRWFSEGLDFEVAQAAHIQILEGKLADAEVQITELKTKLESVELGEDPADVDAGGHKKTPEKKTFRNRLKFADGK